MSQIVSDAVYVVGVADVVTVPVSVNVQVVHVVDAVDQVITLVLASKVIKLFAGVDDNVYTMSLAVQYVTAGDIVNAAAVTVPAVPTTRVQSAVVDGTIVG